MVYSRHEDIAGMLTNPRKLCERPAVAAQGMRAVTPSATTNHVSEGGRP